VVVNEAHEGFLPGVWEIFRIVVKVLGDFEGRKEYTSL